MLLEKRSALVLFRRLIGSDAKTSSLNPNPRGPFVLHKGLTKLPLDAMQDDKRAVPEIPSLLPPRRASESWFNFPLGIFLRPWQSDRGAQEAAEGRSNKCVWRLSLAIRLGADHRRGSCRTLVFFFVAGWLFASKKGMGSWESLLPS